MAHIQDSIARPVATAPAAAKPLTQAQLPIQALQDRQTGGEYENDFPALDALDEQTSPIEANRQPEGPPLHSYASDFGGRVREPSPQDPDELYSTALNQATGVNQSQYSGPYAPGNQQQPGGSYDVPMAPASQAAAIGPPNEFNTAPPLSRNFEDFKGQALVHVIPDVRIAASEGSGEEIQRRQEWLPTFLATGGL